MAFKVLLALFGALTVALAAAKDSSRIIGGRAARLGQFPYQVGIITSTSNLCGGSILAENIVITAAHCTDGLPQDGLTIYAGTLNVGEGEGIQSSSYVVHSQYSANAHDYDISIIYLSKLLNIKNNPNIKPIPLIGGNEELDLTVPATVSGYGTVDLALNIAPHLLYVNVPLQTRSVCSKYFPMTPRMICAGITSGQQSSCQGDSGGPLVQSGKLIGIVSYGAGCGLAAPAVYVNVAGLRDWIDQYI